MRKRRHAPAAAAIAISAALALPPSSFAQIKVIISGGFAAAYREALPEFERTTGITVTTVAGSKEPEASRRLIAFLSSDSVTAAIKKSGMEPPRRP